MALIYCLARLWIMIKRSTKDTILRQRAREKWNKQRIKHLELINKGLREKNEARTFWRWFIKISTAWWTTWRSKKRRDTYLTWSKTAYRLERIVEEPHNSVLYYLQGRPDKAFVREVLINIQEDTNVPAKWVSKRN